jgi:uncharacterized Tic20 family protein
MSDQSTNVDSASERETSKEERTWAMACHLASIAGLVIPLGNVFGPLVVWLIKKDEFPLVADQGKESLNFQITLLLAALVGMLLTLVLIGVFVLIALVIYWLVFTVIAAIRANEGQAYRYPFTLRLIK